MAQTRIIKATYFGSDHNTGTTYEFSVASGSITPSGSITYSQLLTGVTASISDDSVYEVTVTVTNGVCDQTTTSTTWGTGSTPPPSPSGSGYCYDLICPSGGVGCDYSYYDVTGSLVEDSLPADSSITVCVSGSTSPTVTGGSYFGGTQECNSDTDC